MLTMRDVSRYFDRVQATDPTTGDDLFLCQFANYDGSKRDAFAAYRRVISTDPDVEVPADRCIEAMGSVWILGDDQTDGWSELHRRKYVAHRARGTVEISTLAEKLESATPTSTWGDLRWVSDKAEEAESSDTPMMYVAVLPSTIEVKQYDVIALSEQIMLVQSSALLSSGLREARGMVQDYAGVASLSLVSRVFSPATGGYVEGVGAAIPTLKVRWQELFQYGDQMDARFQEGDDSFTVPADTVAHIGDTFIYASQRYLVKNVRAIAGVKVLHGRPAV